MISDVVLHTRTREDIEAFLAQPTHSLLLVGANGSGKPTLAKAIVCRLLNIKPEKLDLNQYYQHIQPVKNSISIESIRQAQDFVRLKTAGTGTLRRAILIEDAHYLTTEAQNAFLKLLEEPPEDTLIVMTAVGGSSLLPTITSRAPKIMVKAPLQADAKAYFEEQGLKDVDISRSYHLSRGQMGMMTKLLQNQDDDMLQYINQAKQFLSMKSFERLVFVDQFVKQKQDLKLFLWALQRVSDAALYQSAQKDVTNQVNKWQQALQLTLEAQDNLNANPQTKLLLTNLSLNI